MSIRHAVKIFGWAIFALTIQCAIGPSCALGEVIDDFESGANTWVPIASDASAHPFVHERVVGQSHLGASCERISIRAGVGTYAYFGHQVRPARVVSDLNYAVWIDSAHPGIQIVARVVFPRSLSPDTGQPITTLVFGDKYNHPGRWSQLGIRDIDQQVNQQIPALRVQHGSSFDGREAYVDLVLLNLYSSPGITTVQIDDLEAEGQLLVPSTGTEMATRSRVVLPGTTGADVHISSSRVEATANGQVVEVDGRARVHRVIDYNGEPLSVLRGLGFNAIRTSEAPSAQLQQELRDERMLAVSSPPSFGVPSNQTSILAWELPIAEGEDAFSDFAIRASDLKLQDGDKPRPILAIPQDRFYEYSQHSDIIASRIPVLGTSRSLLEYTKLLQSWNLFTAPSISKWAVLPSQYSDTTRNQVTHLSLESNVAIGFHPAQLEKAAFLAVSHGARGIIFESHSSLTEDHPVDAQRRAALALINRRMELIEPWIAAGTSVDGVTSSDPNVHVAMLRTPTAHLLIAVRTGASDQFVAGPIPNRKVTVQVRGVPQAAEAYRIGDTRLHSIPYRRGLGEMQVTLEEQEHVSFVVFTQDLRVIPDLRRRTQQHRADLVQLRIDVARQELDLTSNIRAALEDPAESVHVGRGLDQAWSDARQAERLYEAGNLDSAHQYARDAENKIAQIQQLQWKQWDDLYSHTMTNPTLISYDLLPFASRLQRNLAYLEPGPNVLPGGDMEDLTFLLSSGWEQVRSPQKGFVSKVELTPHQPHGGNYALAMQVQADQQGLYARPEKSPIAVRSAMMQVPPKRLVLIQGWLKIPRPLRMESSVVIYDSLGGRDLGIRFRETAGDWTEFTLIRATGEDNLLQLTVELDGAGQVLLDDLTCRVYEERRRPQVAPGLDTDLNVGDRFQSIPSP